MTRVPKCGTVVRPGDPGYDDDCVISNARFDYRPLEIHYCVSAQNVASAIKKARDLSIPVRIRSGGHQHEGMCSANNVLLIDISCLNQIGFLPGGVWIGAGARLKDIYAGLWQRGYLFSGGGCGDVHVGGLAQGGGWGPVSRKFGLTCDNLMGVEMVDAYGVIHLIDQGGSERDRQLLEALRGGGGGNFGVVTRYYFRLLPWASEFTDITLTWGDENLPGDQLEKFIYQWVRLFPSDGDTNLTTFLRLGVMNLLGDNRVVVGGRYLGSRARAQETMARLLKDLPPPRSADYDVTPPPRETFTAEGEPLDAAQWETIRNRMATLRGYQPGPIPASDAAAATAAGTLEANADLADLSETCAGNPLRHKISSGFVNPNFGGSGVLALTQYIRATKPVPNARQYVSLHCLGGAIKQGPYPSSFAFRNRNILLQYQAWWQRNDKVPDGPCIDWIEGFRRAMNPHTDGAFINFVDRDIPLHDYYKDKFTFLIQQKGIWDEKDFFKFEMSIPTS